MTPIVARIAIVAFILAVAAPASAQTDKEKARRHFDQGEMYMNTGVYDLAIQEYTAAYELMPDAHALRFNIALAHEKWGKLSEALDGYKAFVAKAPDSDKAPEAQARIIAIERKLPVDVVTAPSLDADSGHVVKVEAIPADEMALDIGPATARGFADEIARSRTLFWNGPMGVFERKPFADGTLQVARSVADNKLAFRVIGGGDSAAAAAEAGVEDRIDHVSTGGGASLEFIQGLTLPGIQALE